MGNPRALRVGEVLVKAAVIDPLQLRSALAQHDAWGGRLANVVVEMGLADEEAVVDALARSLGMQRVRVGNVPRDPQALAKIDMAFAEDRGIFPVALRDNGKVLLLAMADPSDLDTVDEVSRRARARVTPYIAGEREIRAAINYHYRGVVSEGEGPPRRTHAHPSNPAASTVPGPGLGIAPPFEEEEEEEFKLVDMSGNTVMRPLAEILGENKDGERSSAADLLDDMLGPSAPAFQFSEEDLQRVRTVQLNQEKSARIIRAVMELLLEKGAVTRQGIQDKLRS